MYRRTLKTMLVVVASCAGISILLLEFMFWCFGEWRIWMAAFREPVDLFSASSDLTQLEELDVVRGTVRVLGGSYSYTYDNGIQDTAFYFVLPIDTAQETFYMGIRETRGRKEDFRRLAVRSKHDIKPMRIVMGNPWEDDFLKQEEQVLGEPINIEGFVQKMDENQYRRFLTWLEKSGYYEPEPSDGQIDESQMKQFLPYFIEEADIAYCQKAAKGACLAVLAGMMLLAGSAAAVIFQKRRRERQQYVTIHGTVYLKAHLEPVNDLVMNIELLLAVQALSRITGLDMTAAEKVIRRWDRYWY